MRKDWSLTQDSFDRLLAWLAPEREEAGRRYEEVRRGLVKIFASRGCHEPEDLADESINRVVERLREIEGTYTGNPALYFYGVANNVHREYLRRRLAAQAVPAPASVSEEESELERRQYECLQRCVARLTAGNREIVLQYYREERREKIDNRRQLAERLGIALNALRIRAHRIRLGLQKCVEECLGEGAAG